MKKIYILAAMVAFAFSATAQIDYETDFEFFALGDISAQDPAWRTWSGTPGGDEDGDIVDTFSNSGDQSLLIPGAVTSDIVLLTPTDPDSGMYTVQFMAYIPAGKSGYLNMQADETPEGMPWQQALMGGNVYFNCDGSSGGTGKVSGGTACEDLPNDASFSYPEGEWFKVDLIYDLDAETWAMSINDNEQFADYPLEFNTQELFQLAGINFFTASANNEMYIDDVKMGESILGTNDFSTSNFNVYPNPVKDRLNISSTNTVDAVVVYDVLGKVVLSATPGVVSPSIDMSALTSGAYLVNITINGASKTVKVVK
jgi:Secretion system C-terminal sorting domain